MSGAVDVIKDIGSSIGVLTGLSSPSNKQDKAIAKAEEDARVARREEVKKRQQTQKAALQNSTSLFDILGGAG